MEIDIKFIHNLYQCNLKVSISYKYLNFFLLMWMVKGNEKERKNLFNSFRIFKSKLTKTKTFTTNFNQMEDGRI